MRARWRMLALGCIIVAFCVQQSEHAASSPHAKLAEVGIVIVPKSILIKHSTEYIEFSGVACHNFLNFFIGNLLIKSPPEGTFLTRIEMSGFIKSFCGNREVDIVWQRIREDAQSYSDIHSVGGCMPGIAHDHSYLECITGHPILRDKPIENDGNIGAQLPLCRIFHCIRESLSCVGTGLGSSDSVSCFVRSLRGYANASTQKITLQQSNYDQSSGRINEPSRKTGEIFRINRKLAIVFGDLPFGIYFIFGLIGGGIVWCSFIILESGRRVAGYGTFLVGLIVLLGNGFAVIGAGPLGWITWIAGN
jgi:hypothetical protein